MYLDQEIVLLLQQLTKVMLLYLQLANDGTNPDIDTLPAGDVNYCWNTNFNKQNFNSPKIGTSILDTNGNELALLTAQGFSC